MKIKFIEDDLKLGSIITQGLEILGHEVHLTNTLDGFMEQLNAEQPELLLLDLEIGGQNAADLLPFIHSKHPKLPIIVASSHNDGAEVSHCYDAGARFYVKKPYDIREIDCLIHKLDTQAAPISDQVPFGNCILNLSTCELFYQDKQIKALSEKEYQTLRILVENFGSLVSRNYLLREIWHNEEATDSLNMTITRLRKLLKVDSTLLLENHKGQGYMLHYQFIR